MIKCSIVSSNCALCAQASNAGSWPASENSAGTGSPGSQSFTGSLSTQKVQHSTSVRSSAACFHSPTCCSCSTPRVSQSRCSTCCTASSATDLRTWKIFLCWLPALSEVPQICRHLTAQPRHTVCGLQSDSLRKLPLSLQPIDG